MLSRVPRGTVPIVTTEPYAGWARVAALFYPPLPVRPGVHLSAFVAEGARVDPSAEVGPFALVEDGAEVGARCRIGPYAAVGSGVVLGPDCRIGAHASLSHALVGARVYVYPGARIGQEGFSFARAETGFLTIPQLEHFPSLLNRVGFPRHERSDSSHVLAEEAGMHGECAVG